jgi:lipopolysaccharide cholinephosphotransferase
MGKGEYTQEELTSMFIGVIDFLKESNIPIILYYGTLLGFVRDNSFISGDDDIDVLVSKKDFVKLKTFISKKMKTNSHIKFGIVIDYFFQLYYNGLGPFDFYSYDIDNDNILIKWDGGILYPQKYIFPLESTNWHGFQVYIPNNSEAILQMTYGENWKIPKKKTEYDWWQITNVKFKD